MTDLAEESQSIRWVKGAFRLLQATFQGWLRGRASLHAAALAFFTIFSMAPLLILAVNIGSQAYEQSQVEVQIIALVQRQAGDVAANYIRDIISTNRDLLRSRIATGISVLFLIFGASAVFFQLQIALDAMWYVTPRRDRARYGIFVLVRQRILAALIVLVLGYVLIGAILLNAVWDTFSDQYLEPDATNLHFLLPVIRVWASPVIYTLIFTVIYKIFPQASIRWRDILPGAVLTALLFWLGNYLIGLYLSRGLIATLYGAAGSVIVFLLWLYYSAMIFLFGAKFTHLYAVRYGAGIQPHANTLLQPAPALQKDSDPE